MSVVEVNKQNSIVSNSSLAQVLTEMEENGKRILKENCSRSKLITKKREIKVTTNIFRAHPPAPIMCVVKERCPTPDQIVDATVSNYFIRHRFSFDMFV